MKTKRSCISFKLAPNKNDGPNALMRAGKIEEGLDLVFPVPVISTLFTLLLNLAESSL